MRTYDDVLRHVAQPGKAPTRLAYFICATPRSGSTLLCECLSLTGVAGVPDEWMLDSNESLAKGSFGIAATFDDPGYIPEIIAKSRTPNGVFGAKLMWPEMERLRRGAWRFRLKGPAVRDSEMFPNLHYLRMSRRDKLRQAISFYLAVKTNDWHRMRRDEHLPPRWPVEALQTELAVPATRRKTMEDLSARLAVIEQQEREWDRFFAEELITPFEVVYERLSADPVGVAIEILNHLRLEPPENLQFSRSWHLPMSDTRNEMLLAAYEDYISAMNAAISRPASSS